MEVRKTVGALTMAMAAVAVPSLFAQAPPVFGPAMLDQLTGRIALYPDSLVAQILAAATYPNDIPAAATWADEHHYLTGQALADAIMADQLPWDPSVQALLPFPSVLGMMASDMNWTTQIGDAFLSSEPAVMDSIQRNRRKAYDFGYLRSNGEVVVGYGPYITISPARPGYVVVPYYDPAVVYFRPRPGFAIGAAISFRFGVTIGAFFQPWGWGLGRFDWGGHRVYIDNAVWGRTWGNRATYVHPYAEIRRPAPGFVRPADRHELERRSVQERDAESHGRPAPREEHHGREQRRDDRRDDRH